MPQNFSIIFSCEFDGSLARQGNGITGRAFDMGALIAATYPWKEGL